MIRLFENRVCSLLVVLSLWLTATASAATPPLGIETPLSVPRYGEPTTQKWSADIATDGDSYFAVYTDKRDGVIELVYGTRISAEGEVLDPAGIAFGPGTIPSVVWNGEAYVVVWQSEGSIWAAMVTEHGLTRSRVGAAGCDSIETATNGKTVLVLACRQGYLLGRDLTGSRQFQLAAPVPAHRGSVAAASRGDEYLIAWLAPLGERVSVQRLDSEGMLHAPSVVPEVIAASSVDVASNGDGWLVVIMRGSRLLGQAIAASGVPAGAAREIAVAELSGWPRGMMSSPSVEWRGSEYVVGYVRGLDPASLEVTRVSSAGEPSGSFSQPLPPQSSALRLGDFAVRSDGSGAAIWVSFYDFRVEVGLFDAASIASANPFTKRFSPASAAHEQVLPAMERTDDAAVVAWVEQSFGVTDILLSRPYGAPLLVATNTGVRPFDGTVVQQGWLDVAWDGSTLWVMWFGNGKAGIRRYTRALVPIDAQPVLFDVPQHTITVMAGTAGGGSAMMVFQTREPIVVSGLHQALDVYQNPLKLVAKVVRATDAGVVLTGDVEVTGDAGEASSAVAVWDGTRFFIAWREGGYMNFSTWIRAANVTPQARRVESLPLSLIETGSAGALIAEASPQGIVLAWDVVGGTAVARYTNWSALVPYMVPVPAHFQVAAVAPLANGEVDLYWWKRGFRSASIRYERLPSSLIAAGDAYVTPELPVKDQSIELDAVAIGTTPMLVHSKVDYRPEVGGIVRLFVRQAQVRRRAVR